MLKLGVTTEMFIGAYGTRLDEFAARGDLGQKGQPESAGLTRSRLAFRTTSGSTRHAVFTPCQIFNPSSDPVDTVIASHATGMLLHSQYDDLTLERCCYAKSSGTDGAILNAPFFPKYNSFSLNHSGIATRNDLNPGGAKLT